jgi:hypothetical protein
MLLQRLLLFCSILLAAVAAPLRRENREVAIDWDAFRSLLAEVDEPSIHSILHSLPKYKHGAFEKDRRAIEVVYSEDPALATSLLKLAKRKTISYRNISSPATAPPTTTTTPTSTGLSNGDKAGLSVGLGLGIPSIVVALLAWWFPCRRVR